MRRSSTPIRSALTVVTSAAIAWIAASVPGSIVKSNVAANRTARSMRSLSSLSRKRRVADRADRAALEVVAAADVVDHFARRPDRRTGR